VRSMARFAERPTREGGLKTVGAIPRRSGA